MLTLGATGESAVAESLETVTGEAVPAELRHDVRVESGFGEPAWVMLHAMVLQLHLQLPA